MDHIKNLIDNTQGVNENLENKMQVSKLRVEVLSRFAEYKKTMQYMASDLPISALCLNKKLEKKLLEHDYLRVFELFDVNFAEVEWLDKIEVGNLTSRLNEFLSML
jgi:hypothetical protein